MHGNVLKRLAVPAADENPAIDAPSDTPIDPPPRPSPTLQILRLADREATLTRATGSGDARVHGWLVNDLSFALATPPALDGSGGSGGQGGPGIDGRAREDRVCAAVSALCDIAPRDTLEGMLAAQMVAVHSASLDCLRRAAEAGAADRARDGDLRHAARLLNVFQRQMRVRDDRRNPVLARSLTGRHAPDAAGAPPGARVAPETRVAPAASDRSAAPAAKDIAEDGAETRS